MKLTTLQNWLGAACLLATAGLQAQPDNYYHLNGNFDHGTDRGVVGNLAGTGYATVGTVFTPSPGNSPMINISNYTNAGALIWSRNLGVSNGMPGPSNSAQGMAIAASPALNRYAVVGFTNFTTPQQSVLIQTNSLGVPGLWTPLGTNVATSVAWDPANNHWAVLSYAPTNGGDLMLITVNAAGAITSSNTYDSGPGKPDRPARMMVDPNTGNYVLVGTSSNGFDTDVFVVRTTPFGGLLCSETFGTPGVNETGIDVTYGRNSTLGIGTDVVLAYQTTTAGAIIPFVIELHTVACPSYLSSTQLFTSKPKSFPTAITTSFTATGVAYAICGRQVDVNDNGYIAVIDGNFAAVTYARYGQPAQPGHEDLNDIWYDNLTSQLISVGEHQRTVAWLGSPAGQYYPWLLMTNNVGIGMCPEVPGMSTASITLAIVNHSFTAPFTLSMPITGSSFTIAQTPLNECANPFRLVDAEEMPVASIFPNPAADQVSVMYSTEGSATVTFELTNMLGDVVLSQQLPSGAERADINVSSLSAGMYFYRITSGENELAADKLVIRR
jgi:hypothetical protein